MSDNLKTRKHLKDLKNPEYAKRHKEKMIRAELRDLTQAIKVGKSYSGGLATEEDHVRNINVLLNNLKVTINANPENITWY